MLLTVVLAALGVAAFATNPTIFAVTVAVALVTLVVLAERLGRSPRPPLALPTPEMLLGIPDVEGRAAELADESEPVDVEAVSSA